MHKFLLAENPQAPETGGLWIVHLPNPICIIEAVTSGQKFQSKNAAYHQDFKYINTDGIVENWQLRLYHYFTTDFDERKNSDALAKKIIDEAWHWYRAYLAWEDKNIDNSFL